MGPRRGASRSLLRTGRRAGRLRGAARGAARGGRAGRTGAGGAARPCQAAEHRQFDFWVGQWEALGAAGKKAGQSRVELIANGCALPEQWTGGGGVSGKSLNIYSSGERRWHQTWVDNSGVLLLLAGGFVGRSMVLSMSGPSAGDPKVTQTQRITWTPGADGSVRRLWESSIDAGRSWIVRFDGRHVRAR
jgi:hypothetical protein